MKLKLSVRNVILGILLIALFVFLVNAFISNPALFITQVINGLAQGAIFALVALGYTMVYGIIELVNFAHGDVYMVGAMLSLTIASLMRASEKSEPTYNTVALILMFLTAPLVCATLNFSIEKLAYRPLRNSPRLAALITAIGVSFILEQLGLFWAQLPSDPFIYFGGSGSQPKGFPSLIPKANLFLNSGIAINFTPKHLFALGLAIPIMIALALFVQRTRMGKAMRATAQNRDAARLMGINIDRVISMTFIIGGALAGIGGAAGGLYFEGVQWNMGFDMGLKAFTSAVLGGIGNITGAMMGGFFIGLISALSDQYLAGQWTRAVVFGVLVLVLVFRPSGFLGSPVSQKA